MIVRLLWFASVFCLSGWVGAHWGGHYPTVAVPQFDPASTIQDVGRPLQELSLVLKR